MTKHWKIAVAFVGALIAATLVFQLMRSPEPKYQGRSVRAWLGDMAAHKWSGCDKALRAIGTNAVPYAVHDLANNDSLWPAKYRELYPRFPLLLQKILPAPKPMLQVVDGANVFFYIGSNSIPCAIALLKHHSHSVRQSAAWGIGALRPQCAGANQAIPALIEASGDSDRYVRLHVMLAFREMGADASNAVPAITKVLADTGVGSQTNSFFYVRAAAAVALGKIGPSAAAALPALKAALREPNSYLRGQAAVATWRVAADADTALAVLLQEMPFASESEKWDWIVALGEMGPRARAAVPQLTLELRQDKINWVLNHLTNALVSIDPKAAAKAGVK
jgi:hypothetical protein